MIFSFDSAVYRLTRLQKCISAVWEAHASRHNEGLIKDLPWTPWYQCTVIFKGFQRGPQLGSHDVVRRGCLGWMYARLALWTFFSSQPSHTIFFIILRTKKICISGIQLYSESSPLFASLSPPFFSWIHWVTLKILHLTAATVLSSSVIYFLLDLFLYLPCLLCHCYRLSSNRQVVSGKMFQGPRSS